MTKIAEDFPETQLASSGGALWAARWVRRGTLWVGRPAKGLAV